jgi:hypothetical protein
MTIPLLETCDIRGKDIAGDTLLTPRAIATYVVERQAHYHPSMSAAAAASLITSSAMARL